MSGINRVVFVGDKPLSEHIAGFYDDPLGYVMFNWPWGKSGTRLEKFDGPEDWIKELLEDLGKEIRSRKFNGRHAVLPVRTSVAGGHGTGKTTFLCLLAKFILDTRPYSRGIISNSRAGVLEQITFPDLKMWNALSYTGHLWEVDTTAESLSIRNKQFPMQWFASGERAHTANAEGFAGLFAARSSPFYLFDDAAFVTNRIAQVVEGGLTDGEPFFLMVGTNTRGKGYFAETQKPSSSGRWIQRTIDSRETILVHPEFPQRMIDTYGEDSDIVRVRVRGLPPVCA